MRDWVVAGALIEGDEGLVLVCNRRRDGSCDWSPPGGVVDAGEEVRSGLEREVREETGLVVTGWEGPVYVVETVARDLGWRMRAEVYRAVAWEGRLATDDPDGIVVDARFVAGSDCHELLLGARRWVAEPLSAWLSERWAAGDQRSFAYQITGAEPATAVIIRT
ncbi:MAG: NUDIX hydrolase [Acidimicrobiales bacterium]